MYIPQSHSVWPAFVLVAMLIPGIAFAQDPQPDQTDVEEPPPGWTGSFGGGLALTQGNTDTSTINLTADIRRDTGSNVDFRSRGLYIRGESDGELQSDRLSLDGRIDRAISERTSVFSQLQFLNDQFKEIDYLISPGLGLSHFPVKTDRTEFGVDSGVGVVWERNAGEKVRTDGALTAGQNFRRQISETSEITQRASALWTMSDFEDGLYVFSLALSASITARTQIKAEALNTYKSRPPTPEVEKNDVAVLLSIVYRY